MNQPDDETVTSGLNTLNVRITRPGPSRIVQNKDSIQSKNEISGMKFFCQVTHQTEIHVHTFPTGRGICSKDFIPKGNQIFTVHDVITPRHIFENSHQLIESISKAQDRDPIWRMKAMMWSFSDPVRTGPYIY